MRILTVVSAIVFFPYLGSVEGLDLQPFFLIALFLLFLRSKLQISPIHLVTLTTLTVVIIFYGLFPTDATFTESFFVPLVFVALMTFILGSNDANVLPINSQFILVVASIYVTVGFVQVFEPSFLTQLVSRSTDVVEQLVSSGRGVRSLCAEPAQFGRLLVSLNAIYILLAVGESKRASDVLSTTMAFLLANIFLAQSLYSVFMHFVVVGSFFFLCNYFKLRHRITGIAVGSVGAAVFAFYFAESRLTTLIPLFLDNYETIFNYGASRRLVNPLVSVLGGLINGEMLGYRFADPKYVKLFGQIFYLQPKMFGGYVELIYRFGVFGLFGLICIVKFTWQSRHSFLKRVRGINIFIFVYLASVPFQYGPLLNPLPLVFILICVLSNRGLRSK
jgi:hypothetical protein